MVSGWLGWNPDKIMPDDKLELTSLYHLRTGAVAEFHNL